MSEPHNAATSVSSGPPGDDPLKRLHHMSTTAGAGATDYVAINPLAVASFVVALAGALVFLSWALLLVPLAALVMAGVALRQISDSNGTQGGRKLAIGAILISVVFAGIVGTREVQRYRASGDAQRQIAGLVTQLAGAMQKGDWAAAYPSFSPEFQERWPLDKFAARMNELRDNPRIGALRGAQPGPRVIIENTPGGERGYGNIEFDFAGPNRPSTFTAEYRNLEGRWLINDIPDLFPPEPIPPPQ